MRTLSFQAPEEVNDKLEAFAKTLERSKGYLIRQALEDYLEELEDYMAARQYKAQYNPEENVSFDDIKRKYMSDE